MSIPEWNAAQSDFYATHDRTQEAWPEGEDEPVVEWRGSETAKIARGTNPWLSRQPDGSQPINLVAFAHVHGVDYSNECDQCGRIMRGVIEGMDSDEGIQRCDQCELFGGDLQAALALLAFMPEGTAVWFHGTN